MLNLVFVATIVSAQNNINIIHLPEAFKLIQQNSNSETKVVIAIIDRGVDVMHEDLANIIWVNPFEIADNQIDDDMNGFIDDTYGWNFDNNTNDITNDGVGNWHGTPVNGIIGACHNNYGVNGVCTSVQLMNLVKGESIESIKNSLRYIYKMRRSYNTSNGKAGAFIVAVNCSWGKDTLWASDYPDWCALYDSLGSEGVLCVSSVSNKNINVDEYGDMPTTCSSDYLITVTNTNQFDQKVSGAAYGSISVDIGAPGNNSYTTSNSGAYGYFGGTSAAAPYVAGAIGLLYALPIESFIHDIRQFPSETALLIKSAIIDGADPLVSLKGKTTSEGRLNVFNGMKILCDWYKASDLYENIFDSIEILSIYPNLIENDAKILIESSSAKNIFFDIKSIGGQNILSKNILLREGIQSIDLDFSSYQKGIYLLTVNDENEMKTIKIIKL